MTKDEIISNLFTLRAGLSVLAVNTDKTNKLHEETNILEQQQETKNHELTKLNNQKNELQKKLNLISRSRPSFVKLDLEKSKPKKPFATCFKILLITFVILFLPLNGCNLFLSCVSTGCGMVNNSNNNVALFKSFLDGFYYFLLCLGVSFFIFLVVFIFKQMKYKVDMEKYKNFVEVETQNYEEYKIKRINEHKDKVETQIKELNEEIKQIDLKYAKQKTELHDFLTYKEQENNNIINTINEYNLINKNINETLIEQYSSVINKSDWKDIDLILFNCCRASHRIDILV